FGQDRLEAICRLPVGALDFGHLAECLYDQVDRPMIEVQSPSIRKHAGLGTIHARPPGWGWCSCASGGQGFCEDASAPLRGFRYSPPVAITSSTLLTWSAWPPS